MVQTALLLRTCRRYSIGPLNARGSSNHRSNFHKCIVAASRQHNYEEVLAKYDAWVRSGSLQKPEEAFVHRRALTACERLGLWSKALAILREVTVLEALQPRPSPQRLNLFVYATTLGACSAGSKWEASLDLFFEMQHSVAPDLLSYSAVVESCRSARQHVIGQLLATWFEPCLQTTLSKISDAKEAPWYLRVTLATLVRRQLWSEALDLFWQVGLAAKQSDDTKLLNIAISAHQRGQQARNALKLLQHAGGWLGPIQLPPANSNSFVKVATSLSPQCDVAFNQPAWCVAVQLLEQAAWARLQPDSHIFTAVASACSQAHAWHAALQVLEASQRQCLEWDNSVYSALLHASNRNSLTSDLNFRSLWRQLHAQKLQPNVVTYGAAIGLCERSHRWVDALHLLREMQCPNATCLTSVLAACAAGSAWAIAVHLFWTMPPACGFHHEAANSVNFLHALGKAFHWRQACSFLSELRWAVERGGSWQHYFAAADACGQAGQWQHAMHLLLEELPWDAPVPASYRFSAAISACKSALALASDKGNGSAELRSSSIWEMALVLFSAGVEKTRTDGKACQAWCQFATYSTRFKIGQRLFVADMHAFRFPEALAHDEATVFSATISTLEKMAMWAEALSIFHDIPLQDVNRADYMTVMLALCSGGRRDLAHQVFKERRDTTFLVKSRCLVLDLHNMPVSVAELAVETALNDLEAGDISVRGQASQPHSIEVLEIITGRGARSQGEALVREAVLRMLEAKPDVTLEPSSNPGLVICRIAKANCHRASRCLQHSGCL